MRPRSGAITIENNDPNSNDLLNDIKGQLKGKGQIKHWATIVDPGSFTVCFSRFGLVEKLNSLLKTKSAKAMQDQSFTALSELVTRGNVKDGQVLLQNIKDTFTQKGKLRGKDIADAITRFQNNSTKETSQVGLFVPYGQTFAPRSGGVHFLQDSPLDLNAERIIVPQSIAQMKKLTPVSETGVARFEFAKGKTYLIGMDEPKADQISSEKFAPGDIKTRYEGLLKGCSGAVVISPLSFEVQALEEMFDASLNACEDQPHLTITFAIPQHAYLGRASAVYAKCLEAFNLQNSGMRS